jgi:hypothetical protein
MVGDFRQLASQNQRIGSLETKANSRNAAISGLISHFFWGRADCRNAWLGREDSNLRMVESKSTALPLGDAPTTDERDGKRLPRPLFGHAGL